MRLLDYVRELEGMVTPEEEAEAQQRFEEARRRYASMIGKAR